MTTEESVQYKEFPAVAIVFYEDKDDDKFFAYPIYFENGQMNDLFFNQNHYEDTYTIIPAPPGTIARVYDCNRAEEIYFNPPNEHTRNLVHVRQIKFQKNRNEIVQQDQKSSIEQTHEGEKLRIEICCGRMKSDFDSGYAKLRDGGVIIPKSSQTDDYLLTYNEYIEYCSYCGKKFEVEIVRE